MPVTDYILACDERGTTRWPSPSRTWAVGGFVTPADGRDLVIDAWHNVKANLCRDPAQELKWSHFFPGHHQESDDNPLLSDDPAQWRDQAMWALNELFSRSTITPITSAVRKDKASNAVFLKPAGKGRKVLDVNTLWVGIIGQFAVFLMHHKAKGEMWFDRLGSAREERQRQRDWSRMRNHQPIPNPLFRESLKQIAEPIAFLNSADEPMIQIADFISGVVWAAAEGDEAFLLGYMRDYFPWGKRTYTFMYLT